MNLKVLLASRGEVLSFNDDANRFESFDRVVARVPNTRNVKQSLPAGVELYQSSAKIDKAVELPKAIRDTKTGEGTILFSQWTFFLDLLEVPLVREFEESYYRRLDGKMDTEARDAVVQDLMRKDSVKLL